MRDFTLVFFGFLLIISTYVSGQNSKKIGETIIPPKSYSKEHPLTASINDTSFVVVVKSDDQFGNLVCYNQFIEELWKISLGQLKNIDVAPFFVEKENKVTVFFQTKLGGKHRLEVQYFDPLNGKSTSKQLLVTDSKKLLKIKPSSKGNYYLITDHNGKGGVRSNNHVFKLGGTIEYSKNIGNKNFEEERISISNKGEILIVGKDKEGKILLDSHDASSRNTLLTVPLPEDKKNYLVASNVWENDGSFYVPVFEEVRKVGVLQLMVGEYSEKTGRSKIVKSEYFFPRYLNKILVKDFRGTKIEYSEKGYLKYKGVLGIRPNNMIFDKDGSFYVTSEVFTDGKTDLIREVPNDRNYNYSNQPFIKAKEVLVSGFKDGNNTWNKLFYRFGYQEIRKVVEKGEEVVASSFLLDKDRLMFIFPDQDEHTKQNCVMGSIDKKTGQLIFRERFFHSKIDHIVSKNLMAWLSPSNVVLFNCSPEAKDTFYLTSFDFSDYLEW